MHEIEEWEKQQDNKTALDIVSEKEQALLKSEDVGKAANLIGQEKIKSELAEKAAEIKSKNVETAEKEFETETRSRRLKQLTAKLDLEHKYEMSIIKENGEHYAMLDKRKKLQEKYGYLYKKIIQVKSKDDNGNIIVSEKEIMEDMSYSVLVNKIRTFTRNLSKLDKTIKQMLKIVFFVGLGIGAIMLIKFLGIL